MENKMELAPLALELNPLTVYVEQVSKGAAALSEITAIESQVACNHATELLQKAKKLTAIIDKEVEAICRPVKDWKAKADGLQRAVKAEAELIKTPLSLPLANLENMITNYVRKVREEQARELARQQAVQKRIEEVSFRGLVFDGIKYVSIDGKIEQHEINNLSYDFAAFIKSLDAVIAKRKKAAEKKGEEFVMTGPEEAPLYCAPVPVILAPEVKGMTVYWKHEILNPEAVPLQYCTPDPVKINAAIKQGVRDIPGVRIFSEEKIKRTI
jgi:hypothetical protein